MTEGELPRGFVRAVVDRVIPSIVGLLGSGQSFDAAALGHEHVRHTVQMLQGYSVSLAEAIAEGRCAIIGLEYTLADGRVEVAEVVGTV